HRPASDPRRCRPAARDSSWLVSFEAGLVEHVAVIEDGRVVCPDGLAAQGAVVGEEGAVWVRSAAAEADPLLPGRERLAAQGAAGGVGVGLAAARAAVVAGGEHDAAAAAGAGTPAGFLRNGVRRGGRDIRDRRDIAGQPCRGLSRCRGRRGVRFVPATWLTCAVALVADVAG